MRRLCREERGSVLVLALLVIATLTGLAVAFSGTARTEVNLAAFSRDGLRAEALARAGVEAALQRIAADEDLEKDHLEEDWSRFDPAALPLELPPEARLTGRVLDEAGKLNLNRLRDESGGIEEAWSERVERLFDLLGLDRVARESLFDWLDADDVKRLDGAETFFYAERDAPHPCANNLLLSPGQVRLVQGLGADEGWGEERPSSLLELVTVYSDGKINVNTAPVEVLESLDGELDRSLAEAVADRRADMPFQAVEEVREVPGMEEAVFGRIQDLLTVKSSVFDLRFEGRWGDAVCRVQAVAEREEDGVRLVYWRVH